MQPSRFTLEFDLPIAGNFQYAGLVIIDKQYVLRLHPTNSAAQHYFLDISVYINLATRAIESVEAEDPSGYIYQVQLSNEDKQFILATAGLQRGG